MTGNDTHLILGQLGLDCGPCFTLRRIAKQIHDYRTLGYRLVDIEQIPAWYPAIVLSLVPRRTILSHTDNDI